MRTRQLLLAPAAGETGGSPTTDVIADNPADDLGFSDAVNLLDIPAELKAAVQEKPKAATPADPAASAKPATPNTPAEVKAPEFTADQTAWFELREKAASPEEIAAADAQAPEFSDEQRAYLEAQSEDSQLPTASRQPNAPEFTTPEQKAWVEKQTSELARTKKLADEAAARAAELETKLTALQSAPPPIAGNVHPLALVDTPAQIDAYEESLEKFVTWAKANYDGTDAVPASGDQPAVRAYTAAEIRTACSQREHELRKTIPAAREALAGRQQQVASAQKIYPALFDAKQPEGEQVNNLLRQYPILKVIFPNFHLVAGDAFRGEKLRLAEGKKNLRLPVPPRPGLKIPPRAGASGRSPNSPAPKAKGDATVERLQAALKDSGGNETEALAKLFLS